MLQCYAMPKASAAAFIQKLHVRVDTVGLVVLQEELGVMAWLCFSRGLTKALAPLYVLLAVFRI